MTPQEPAPPLPVPSVAFLIPSLLLLLLSISLPLPEEVVSHVNVAYLHTLIIKIDSSTHSRLQGDTAEDVSRARLQQEMT